MSFLSGRFEALEEGHGVRLTDDRLIAVAMPGADGTPVTLGIRPEAFKIDAEGPLHLASDTVEPTGAETLVYGLVAGQAVRCVFRGRPEVAPGQTIRLSVPPEHVKLFDGSTGSRL
jgi:multiple sugar transport system ATP-binding protein